MKKRYFIHLLALLLCFSLLFALCLPIFADFGDFGGDSDYGGGGGDYGGSYGGGGGYSGGGGSSRDYDWGSSSSSYGGSSGDGEFSLPIVIIFIVIMIIAFVARALSDDSGSGGSSYQDSYEYRNRRDDGYRSSDYRRSVSSARSSVSSETKKPDEYRFLKDISLYRDCDPNFSAAKLKQKLSNLYIQMQQCWQEKDIESLRPYFTDAYFSQLDRQLDAYRKKGITNCVDRPVVLNVRLDGFWQEGGEDHIYAILKTRIVDYKLEDGTGRLVSGSRTKERFMTYRYHLTRPTGQLSENEEGTRSVSCPHCGAPVSINETAKCPFCGSVVTADARDFVIAQIEGVSQQTVE